MTILSRRAFLNSSGMACGAFVFLPVSCRAEEGWKSVPSILSRIKAPVFPKRDWMITEFGAISGGIQDCSEAIRMAIKACNRAGGGRVVVPAGDYLTGSVQLRSNVALHVSKGAVLRFSRNPQHYLPAVHTRWEGVECMNYSPFVYAFEQENVAVTGEGILDGQADREHWWNWTGSPNGPSQAAARKRLFQMGETDTPVAERIFGEGSSLRPNFVQLNKCRNVLIEGVTIHNSPMWQVHPVLCTNVTVRGVTMNSHGPNNDGCNPESSRDVLIEDCLFDTGDDCIAIKSGRNRDGRRIGVPSENIVIRNCRMKDGHGGVTIGSEASGGVRNIFAENCHMDSPNLDRALRLKTNSVRGGFIENVYMRNVKIGQVADAVLRVDLFYEEADSGPHPPTVRNIEMVNVTSEKSRFALYLRGYQRSPIRNIRLKQCSFHNVAERDVVENVHELHFDSVRVNGRKVAPVDSAIFQSN